ncbi:hypothetical protein UPYG_G00061770 [Umbra pygmaea]|uniref:Ig-like domain-containing protein n=1 Tax=Umbra pygmaea TaxID=75934 RepID=A0ABD0XWZ6_UMBPY
MSSRTKGSVLVVFLWSVTVVLGQDGWSVTYPTQSICALKGSTVNLSCSYMYPSGHRVISTFWFTEWESGPNELSQDPAYEGRVRYHSDMKDVHSLTIKDVRERDSAEYKFRIITDQSGGKQTGSPGVNLTITGLKMEVSYIGWLRTNKLTCSTTCTLPGNTTYIWYKNGQLIDESTSPQYNDLVYRNYEDSYSCAVKGHEDLQSPAACGYNENWDNVYYQRSICVLKGPKHSGRWRDKLIPEDLTTDPGYAGRVEYPDQESRRNSGPFTLRITDVREEDSAEYRFTFNTCNFEWDRSRHGTTLTVSGLQVEVTRGGSGQNLTLTCNTTCPLPGNPTYIWYKNGQHINESTSPQYKDSVYSDNEDSYSCAVKGREDLYSPVVYNPKNTSVSVSPSGEIVEGSSVTLTCSSDANPPVKKYTWYKKNETSPKASGQSYSITNIRPEDSGEYYCEAENDYGRLSSSTVTVDVEYTLVSPWVTVVGVGSVLTAAALILIIYCILRRCTGGSGSTAETQSGHPDPNSDTYTTLNLKNRSPEYDTLESVRSPQ